MFLVNSKGNKGDDMQKRVLRNNVIKKEDFELYSISMPLSINAFRERKALIEHELEKRHPLFSSNFMTLIRYALKKRKICVETAVIDKSILYEYKKKSGGKTLYFENSRFKYKRINKKTAFLFTGLFLTVIFLFLFYTKDGNKTTENITDNRVSEEVKMKSKYYPSVDEIADLVLSRIYEKHGFITSFEWKDNNCTFNVQNCNPEEIIFDKSCTVSYKNGVPSFSINFPVSKYEGESSDMCSQAAEIQHEVRNKIIEAGGTLQQEFFDTKTISFKYLILEDKLAAVLRSIKKSIDLSLWHENSLSITCSANGIFVSSEFSKGQVTDNEISLILSSYHSLFRNSAGNKFTVLKKNNKTIAPEKRNDRQKIGEIKKGNEIYVYWKYQNGKIISEKGVVNE